MRVLSFLMRLVILVSIASLANVLSAGVVGASVPAPAQSPNVQGEIRGSSSLQETPDTAAWCGGTAIGYPSAFGETAYSSCGVFGYPGTIVSYSWNVQYGTQQYACAEGLGFVAGWNGAYSAEWFSLGCGVGAVVTVPWGNVAATPALRVKSLNIGLALVDFTTGASA